VTRTCVQIVRELCGQLGLTKPNTATSSTDLKIVQMLSILNEEGSKLARRHEWQALTDEATFTTVATASQGTIASIITAGNSYRKILNETIFNRTTQRIVLGPLSPLERQARLAFPSAGPFSDYFIRRGSLFFDPVPAAGESCYFEYVSYNWCTSSDGVTGRRFFTQDEDLPLFDDELLIAGTKWRWNKSKGLDYQEDFNDYEMMVADAITGDKTARRKKLDNEGWSSVRGICVPPGSWNLTNLG
jgi:hypothetical protein